MSKKQKILRGPWGLFTLTVFIVSFGISFGELGLKNLHAEGSLPECSDIGTVYHSSRLQSAYDCGNQVILENGAIYDIAENASPVVIYQRLYTYDYESARLALYDFTVDRIYSIAEPILYYPYPQPN